MTSVIRVCMWNQHRSARIALSLPPGPMAWNTELYKARIRAPQLRTQARLLYVELGHPDRVTMP